jgi:hypothetical protein
LIGKATLVRGGNETDTQGLCQEQFTPGHSAIITFQILYRNLTGNSESKYGLGRVDAVATSQGNARAGTGCTAAF